MHLRPEYASALREQLDRRLDTCSEELRQHAAQHDPIGVVYSYDESNDIEVAAFVASCLAYGQRKVFVPILRRLLREMGRSPYDFVTADGYKRSYDWFRYRFNRPDDLRCLFYGLRHVLLRYGSLESAFVIDDPGDRATRDSLGLLVGLLRNQDFSQIGTASAGTKGFRYLLPDPLKGGACKRLNMFLRWMVRSDQIDFGLWSGLSPDRLVIPLDVHVQNASEYLGLTSKRGSRWSTAVDITDSLSQLDPEDPLKYDFLLFSLGAWDDLGSLNVS